jgi:hypothetical protein
MGSEERDRGNGETGGEQRDCEDMLDDACELRRGSGELDDQWQRRRGFRVDGLRRVSQNFEQGRVKGLTMAVIAWARRG